MMASGEAHRKKKVRVVIVGAGIAGLTAARMLAKEGINVILIEGRDRAGGRIHTFDVSNGTTYSSGQPDEANYVDLGASFVHGHIGNPLSALQKQAGFRLATPKDDETSAIWYDRANGQKLTEEQSIKAGYFAHATVFEGLHRIAQDTDYMASEADNLWSALISKDEPFSQIWKGVVREEKAGIFSVLKMWTGWTGAMYANTALKWWGFEQEYVGKDLVVQPGYQSLVRWSVDEIAGQGGSIMLGEKVTEVRLDEDKRGVQIISTKAEYSADFVISSLPLGVMQHCPPDFTPALPVRRKQSIDSLGMGLLNKIVVTYDHAWWKKATSSPWFMVLPSRIATEAEGYQLPQEKVPQTIAEAQWLLLHNGLFFQDYTQLTGKNTLVCFLGPPSAHAQEMLDDEWVVNTVHERLARSILTLTEREMLSRPSASVVTRWGTDEFSRGSYSYFSAASRTSAGSGPADMLEQARPLWGGRLGFAGEHTSVNCFASVHGALLSGQREAKRVLSLIQLGQEGENDYEN